MPAFADNKNVMCYLNDIYVYLRARSSGRDPARTPREACATSRPSSKRPKTKCMG